VVIERDDASVCLTDPGFDVDVTIRSDIESLYRIWLGQVLVSDALRSGQIAFDGPTPIVRRLPQALQLSPIAEAVARAQQV
jgi:hypothetical protein